MKPDNLIVLTSSCHKPKTPHLVCVNNGNGIIHNYFYISICNTYDWQRNPSRCCLTGIQNRYRFMGISDHQCHRLSIPLNMPTFSLKSPNGTLALHVIDRRLARIANAKLRCHWLAWVNRGIWLNRNLWAKQII